MEKQFGAINIVPPPQPVGAKSAGFDQFNTICSPRGTRSTAPKQFSATRGASQKQFPISSLTTVHQREGGACNATQGTNKLFDVYKGINLIGLGGRELDSGKPAISNILIFFYSRGGDDSTPPTVSIEYPTNGAIMSVSTQPLAGFVGTADDDSGVLSSVTWTNVSHAVSGTATGTTTWTSETGITLSLGTNILRTTATARTAIRRTDTLTVIFSPPASASNLRVGKAYIGGAP